MTLRQKGSRPLVDSVVYLFPAPSPQISGKWMHWGSNLFLTVCVYDEKCIRRSAARGEAVLSCVMQDLFFIERLGRGTSKESLFFFFFSVIKTWDRILLREHECNKEMMQGLRRPARLNIIPQRSRDCFVVPVLHYHLRAEIVQDTL